jgi:hypothetical protein
MNSPSTASIEGAHVAQGNGNLSGDVAQDTDGQALEHRRVKWAFFEVLGPAETLPALGIDHIDDEVTRRVLVEPAEAARTGWYATNQRRQQLTRALCDIGWLDGHIGETVTRTRWYRAHRQR